jgi:peptidoglycan/LPS O-acetylase OafA/YrhL
MQNKFNFKALSNKLLAAVGKVSFSMYLVHFGIIYMFNRIGFNHIIDVTSYGTSILNFILMYFIVAICTYAISAMTYKLIEVSGQNLGRHLIKKIDNHSTLKPVSGK